MIDRQTVSDYCKALGEVEAFMIMRSSPIYKNGEFLSIIDYFNENQHNTLVQRSSDIIASIWNNTSDTDSINIQCSFLFEETKRFHAFFEYIYKQGIELNSTVNEQLRAGTLDNEAFYKNCLCSHYCTSLGDILKFVAKHSKDKEIKREAHKLALMGLNKPQEADIVRLDMSSYNPDQIKAMANHLVNNGVIEEVAKDTFIQACTEGVNTADIEPIKWLKTSALLGYFVYKYCETNDWKTSAELFVLKNGQKINTGSIKEAISDLKNNDRQIKGSNIIDNINTIMKKANH